jgi:hypothetical protein
VEIAYVDPVLAQVENPEIPVGTIAVVPTQDWDNMQMPN